MDDSALLSCDQCEEWLPGYVLHTLEPEEAAAVAEHLRTCVRCPASLAAYEAVLDGLGEAVPPHDPPADLQRRVRATVAAQLAPVVPTPPPPLPRWWQVWTPRWALVLAVVNAALFLGAVWWAWQERQEASRLRDQLQQAMRQLELQQRAVALLTDPDSRLVDLPSAASTQARGTLLLHASTPYAVLVVQDLPPLQPDRVYQLWLRRGDIVDNGGVFRVDAQGFGVVLVHAPYPLAAYQRAGITEEPAGGSPRSTSSPVIRGPLAP